MSGQTVAEIGEFGLIKVLVDALPDSVRTGSRLTRGIGDDAAIWQPTAGESLLVTADSLVEGVQYRLDWTDWHSLGHKALAVNLSDIAAMAGVPRLAVVSLALTGQENVDEVQAMYSGLGALAERFGVLVAGGDVVRSPSESSIHVTLLGETSNGRYLTRDGARPGDFIMVSGMLGASAAGLKLLQLPGDDPRRIAQTSDQLLAAHLRPEPRVALGQALVRVGASSAIDLSDGLFGDLPRILTASHVATEIEADAIPAPAAVRALFPDEWFDLATLGGEDYELLFTFPPEKIESAQQAATAIGHTVTKIGKVLPITDSAPYLVMIEPDGTRRAITQGAWDHFGK